AFSTIGVWAFLESQGLHPAVQPAASPVAALGLMSAALYAAALACGVHLLSDANARALREEENRYRLLSGQMSAAFPRHGRNGSILYISPAAAPIFGTSVSDLLGGGLLGRVHPADRVAYCSVLADAAEFGHQRTLEFRILRETNAKEVAQM